MRKHKFLLGLTALATTITPVVALASCNKKSETNKSIPESMLNIESGILLGLKEGASVDAYDTLVIPEDVTVIAKEAFKDTFKEDTNGSTIKTIVFNSKLSFIGENAFSGCDAIAKLDLTKMKDIKIMGLKLGTDSFTTWKNSGGTAVLPEGITDMQKDWIKELFANAGLPGTWFGDEEQGDQETVDGINAILAASGETFNTMSSMIKHVKEVPLVGVDLEQLESTNPTNQYVWDSENQVVIQLNSANELVAGPEGYSLNPKKVNLWKMVKPSDSSKLLKSAKKKSNEVYADEFSSTTPYSQYLRTDYKETWEGNKTLSFQSGLDTGNVQKLELTFTPTDPADTPVINTMKSSLTINGSLDSVDHYGNLTELTVTSLGSGTYTEYGSVDAAIVVKQGNIVAEAGSDINEVLVACETVAESTNVKVTVAPNGAVGSVGAQNADVAAVLKTNKIVEVSEQAAVETNVVTDSSTPVPSESNTFYSGDGSKLSPYTIKTADQLMNFSEKIRTRSETDNIYFNLIADIDMTGKTWICPGTQEKPFKGIFNGCGFKVSNITYTESVSGPKVGHLGFIGYTWGEKNTDFTDDISAIWHDNELDETNIAESKYKTVVKNLTIENATAEDTSKYFVGGLVGVAQCTYFYNCKVTSGSISAQKHAGGLVGTAGSCIFKNCMAGSNEEGADPLTVQVAVYNVGGLVGSTGYLYEQKPLTDIQNVAVIGCETGKNCSVKMNSTQTSGSMGGLVGDNQTGEAGLYDSCINRASLIVNSTSAINAEFVGGIAGRGQNIHVFNNCYNYGSITVPSGNYAKHVSGIVADFANGQCLSNCHNYGAITGNAEIMAGLAAPSSIAGQSCSCGENLLTNTLPGGKTYQLTDKDEI